MVLICPSEPTRERVIVNHVIVSHVIVECRGINHHHLKTHDIKFKFDL